MKIAGIQKNSFVDFPGKVSAVLFTPGCNMNCFYCHNRRLLSLNENEDVVEIDEVSQLLAKRKGFLDAVVISGGEPTLQTGLGRFLEKLKGIGYKVKLDTNGTNPQVIESLIGNNLVDYIAMDIKAPFERYSEVCCTDVDAESIRRSIKVLMEGRI
ncbi:MAG: anaerobic ribonucleoside-triphosphate reductase activating protein, partial [Clostridiaceae bacterium]|nr:anaerobic ribonucleoside-triphosphate reductase activating protein [Clostridiaceae bacterium]